MPIGRTILAALITLSVALLPAAAGGVAAQSPEAAEMSAMDDMDCCPPKANPCDKAMGDCSSMAACALKCFSFSPSPFSEIAFPPQAAALHPLLGTNPFRSQAGSPPFRPPRA